MTNILGPYCSFWHWRGEDEEYIRQLDPAWARIHQPTARAIDTVQRNAPNANIMLRSWDIDDHNGDRKREMYADPKGAARKHLGLWRAKWDELITELHRNNWSADENRWYIGLVNEPDPAYVPQVVEYTREAMQIVKGTSIRLGVVVPSVGNFMKPSEGDRGWTQVAPLEQPINDGRHILMIHEYWQPEGPRFGEDAGNLAWRHHIVPLDVPILIGESGANGFIYNRHSQNDDAGWQKFMTAEQYAEQVREYIEGCDKRVKGVCLYMLDFHSDQWWSFDTRPAMNELLAIKDARPQKPSPFVTKPPTGTTTHLPSIGTGPTPIEPPKEPPTMPAGDTWARSIAFTARWEGGYQNVHNDVGNWTGGAVGVGENKGTNWGVSAASYPHLDIKNLTREEAHAIFFRDYWQASGADKLSWPACLLVFDTAILHGVGTARAWQAEVGTNPLAFAAKRLRVYTKMRNWETWGRGWTNRTAELLEAAAK